MRRCSSSRKSLEPLVQPSSSAGLPQACHPLPETYSSSTVTTSKSRRHPPHQKRCLYCISLVLGFFVSPSLNFRGPVGPSWLNELMQWRMFLHPYQHRNSLRRNCSEIRILSIVGTLTGPGFSSSLFMEECGPLSSMQIARHFFGIPDFLPSVLAL